MPAKPLHLRHHHHPTSNDSQSFVPGLHRPSTPPGFPPAKSRRIPSKLSFGTVCSSNINRSMEAHVVLSNAGERSTFALLCIIHKYFLLYLFIARKVWGLSQRRETKYTRPNILVVQRSISSSFNPSIHPCRNESGKLRNGNPSSPSRKICHGTAYFQIRHPVRRNVQIPFGDSRRRSVFCS